MVCFKELESHCAVSSTVSQLQCVRAVAEDMHTQHMSAPAQVGLYRNPRFPSAQKHFQLGLTVQERRSPQPSQSSRTHSPQLAASPPALCCCQLWPSLDCFHISKGKPGSSLLLRLFPC